jgi:hypothetical protein
MSSTVNNVAFGVDEASLEHTRAVFQPYSATPLDREDCREIRQNLVGAFGVLLRIQRRLHAEERARREAASEAGAHQPEPEVSDE